MNFVDFLLNNGYKRVINEHEKRGRYDGSFNLLNGWMGLTIYHPYECFVKDNKKVELDLSRYRVTDIVYTKDGVTKVDVAEKRVVVTVGDKIIYENKAGIMPDEEIIKLL